jgi:hypothetical protein
MSRALSDLRILTINSHEAWVHQLGYLGASLDIIDGMQGRYCPAWDTCIRPVPKGAKLVQLDEVRAKEIEGRPRYDCIVGHSITDLLDLKAIAGPRILMLHVTLEGRAHNEGHAAVPAGYADMVRAYLDAVGGDAVATSALKARSWSIGAPVVPFGIDVDSYLPHDGRIPRGIRVANQINLRRDYLKWDFHERAFRDVPVDILGHNPDMRGVTPSRSWDDLKAQLSRHRFYVHTADPELEDGYNMASLEAMAAGLPVLGNVHPSSPVVHGESGFLSDDPDELAEHAVRLIENPQLAHDMGQVAKGCVRARFSMMRFAEGFAHCMAGARERWVRRRVTAA